MMTSTHLTVLHDFQINICQRVQPPAVKSHMLIANHGLFRHFKTTSWSFRFRYRPTDSGRSVCRMTPAEAAWLCFEKPTSSSDMKKLWLLHLHSEQQRGSSLLVHNVNLAPIKASVGTSVDNRKSLLIEKHPVVGLRVCDPSCTGADCHSSRGGAPYFKISVYWTKLPYP